MNNLVQVERDQDIGLIRLAHPPVNALGFGLRSQLFAALDQLVLDSAVKAIVLYGEGRLFSAGADIKDFARSSKAPTLPDLSKALNNCPKPTIAALHGVAFGGALELALATHMRVGCRGVKVALPEVKLGLLPGAGGTQRLPRLTGIAAAVDIICSGREVGDEEALRLGILNRLEQGPARDVGLRAARDVLNGAVSVAATDGLTVSADPAALTVARQRYGDGLTAPQSAIAAIAAATGPIDDGMKQERALFTDLMHGEERAGLVHAFVAERATTKIPEIAAVSRDISRVGVVGGGTMGVGIATAALLAGFSVTLIETAPDRVDQARTQVLANLAGALKRGKLTKAAHATAEDALITNADLGELAWVDLVIEAIFENMDAKTDLFRDLDSVCKPGAILATNTSYLDVNKIAAATARPDDVVGLHFFSPAHIMRLLEVVVADATAPDVVATAFAFARRLRKIPVRAGVCDGFIGNRILARYRRLCEYLVLDGAGFDQVDRALQGFGFAMGPFAVGDLSGLDIARATRDRTAASRPLQERYSRVADLICDAGWLGRKTGRGYYLYDGSQQVGPNPGALAIIAAERAAQGGISRNFTDEDIVARVLTAIIQEAVTILEQGIALRPVDIDAVMLFGYGFPRHRGGPMHMADRIGLSEVIGRIESYAVEDPYFWQVPQLLRRLRHDGLRFEDLNAASATS